MTPLSPTARRKQIFRQEYLARINKVIDYIYKNLDEDLTLKQLSDIAIFSPFHFHRLFSALVGETPGAFIKRLRLEKAATALRLNPSESITNIALDCGFSSSSIFSKGFRDYFNLSPSEYRDGGYLKVSPREKSKNKQACRNNSQDKHKERKEVKASLPYIDEQSLIMERSRSMKVAVKVKDMPAMHVAYFRHIGPYKKIDEAFDKLKAWAGPRGLFEQENLKVLGVYHDDPEVTSEDKLHSSACISIPKGTKVTGEMGTMIIPAGKYAVARVEIDHDQFNEAWDGVLGDWLPESGFQPDDRPCYELYINDAKYHPEGKHIVDICEPIKDL